MQATLMMLAALTIAAPLTLGHSVEKPKSRAAELAATAQQEPATDAPVQTPDAQTTDAGGEKWRFRQHDGLWWYWLPSEKWVYWHEGKWVPYDAAAYAELQRSQPTRRYTYFRGGNQGTSGYPELGQWGRVRYDGYGQRQYPYSRRNSGIRQLGPVPAMGGVRSLPGWGGER